MDWSQFCYNWYITVLTGEKNKKNKHVMLDNNKFSARVMKHGSTQG